MMQGCSISSAHLRKKYKHGFAIIAKLDLHLFSVILKSSWQSVEGGCIKVEDLI